MEILLLSRLHCCRLATILKLIALLTAKLLLVLASTTILGSESHGTHDYISLSDGAGTLQTTEISGLKARLPR
jgi:hypothetical protein